MSDETNQDPAADYPEQPAVPTTAPAEMPSTGSDVGMESLSLARVLRVVVPIVVVLVGFALLVTMQLPTRATRELQTNMLAALLGRADTIDGIDFSDEDDDLVADPPPAADAVSPEVLKFSYVAAVDSDEEAELWQPLVDAISEATSTPVEFISYTSVSDQAVALRDGELHITAFNTGAVPMAVSQAGFVPVSTFGDDEGNFGVNMLMLVPTNASVKDLDDLASMTDPKPKILFVRPNSNSGFKAPFVLLMDEYDMYPERDYDHAFTLGYDASMQAIAAGKATAAPVVSDLLEQALADGVIEEKAVRIIYESERFPPASLGYAYNLSEELREGIRNVLLEFDWQDTPLEDRFGASGSTQFVPVNYKDDWANIRRINDVIRKAREQLKQGEL